jgi:hypothetical protein
MPQVRHGDVEHVATEREDRDDDADDADCCRAHEPLSAALPLRRGRVRPITVLRLPAVLCHRARPPQSTSGRRYVPAPRRVQPVVGRRPTVLCGRAGLPRVVPAWWWLLSGRVRNVGRHIGSLDYRCSVK